MTSEFRVSDPETINDFLQRNHVWLDLVDDFNNRIESLRTDLEENRTYDESTGAYKESTPLDSASTRGEIKALREIIDQPSAVLNNLIATEQTEEEQEDANSDED